MKPNTIIQGDCLDELKKLPENSVDAIITDPPYGIGFMGKEWDNFKPSVVSKFQEISDTRAKERTDGRKAGLGTAREAGIYDQSLTGHIKFEKWFSQVATECLRVLKPGGFLLSFGGTRTYHRLVCGIEDAGFEIRDTISWLFGSGFPKSLAIGKQIDKCRVGDKFWEVRTYLKDCIKQSKKTQREIKIHLGYPENSGVIGHWIGHSQEGLPSGKDWNKMKEILQIDNRYDNLIIEAEREIVGKKQSACFDKNEKDRHTIGASKIQELDITIAKTNEAQSWEGWGTALKPAQELICVARKPLSEKNVALNVLKWGTGGINIDDCRIGTEILDEHKSGNIPNDRGKWGIKEGYIMPERQGRFPANIILDEEAGKMLDEQSGILGSNSLAVRKTFNTGGTGNVYTTTNDNVGNVVSIKGKGGASRFFYCAKSSKAERNNRITTSTIKLIKPKDLDILWKEENMELAQLILKDILGLTEYLNIEESGENIMVMCQKECLSTIKMEINKITELKTWNSLTHLLTKDYIQNAFSKKEDGLNHVKFVENLKKLMMTTGISQEKVGLLLGDVNHAIYRLLLMLRENEENWQEDKCSHPTVKPIALMEYLIKLVSKEQAIILDPFLGSGTTAIACLKLNRQFIGIEKEEEYVKIANARIKPFLEQRKLT